jgi:NhaP-type Na+/H+ or K+/H+ antiporter
LESYIPLLIGGGALILLVAWLPMALKEVPLSLPMICVGLGFGLFHALGGEEPLPLSFPVATERLTEIIVIVALMGSGLKLDRRLGWRAWGVTWRLMAISMPLSILGIAWIGHAWLGLGLAAALLLGAVLAPTDPVLASDVQVGPPDTGEEDEVRFALTSEAGLNDGLAFPFVNLALALALAMTLPPEPGVPRWVAEWLAVDVAWKLLAGGLLGWATGRVLGWLMFHLPNRAQLSRTGDGFVALGVTLLAYGLAEAAHGYGFVAVFVAALALRDAERRHAFHERMHDFAEQTERLLMMVLLMLFGGALAGGLLDALTLEGALGGLAFLFIVRPAAGLLGLLGSPHPMRERAAIAFFGIRGLGSFYYLAYALNRADLGEAAVLWAVVGFTVLVSIMMHGITVTPAMRWLDRRRSQPERAHE